MAFEHGLRELNRYCKIKMIIFDTLKYLCHLARRAIGLCPSTRATNTTALESGLD